MAALPAVTDAASETFKADSIMTSVPSSTATAAISAPVSAASLATTLSLCRTRESGRT